MNARSHGRLFPRQKQNNRVRFSRVPACGARDRITPGGGAQRNPQDRGIEMARARERGRQPHIFGKRCRPLRGLALSLFD
jgi:hypothetical protein